MNVLIVENEERLASFLSKGLRAHGHTVERVSTGRAALLRGSKCGFSFIILDLGLPDMDGLKVLTALRRHGALMPVFVLSAQGQVAKRIKALDLGADDCLIKPFAFEELLARVRASLRARASMLAGQLAIDDIRLDPLRREVSVGGRKVSLSAREFSLLQAFLAHPGQVLSQQDLLTIAWSTDFDPKSNVIAVYVRYLRRKLGGRFIETVRGAGYRLRAD